jgi:endonuclease/exonuclease/phosphatase family metal-dependent hydrolase
MRTDPGVVKARVRSRGARRFGWLVPVFLALAALVWVLSASRPGAQVEGCPQGCSAGQGQGGMLRVMSLNVLHGYPRFEHLTRRLDLVADEIRRQDADIVCLQEVPWTRQLGSGADYLSRLVRMNYLYLRANGNRRTIFFEEGEAILSRYPLKDAAFVELKPPAGFFEHRVALHASAATPWGDVDVFVTHLTHGDPGVNQNQAASLLAFVEAAAGNVAVVAGDLNAMPDSPQIEILAQEWVDTYRAANPADEGLTCCIDELHAEGEPLEKRIDYLFLVSDGGQGVEVNGAWRVLARPFRVGDGWQWASDHVGVVVDLELEH